MGKQGEDRRSCQLSVRPTPVGDPERAISARIGIKGDVVPRRTRFSCGDPGHSLLSTDVWLHLGATLGLSPRELQIVQGVFDDQKEQAIAAGLGISPHTVNTHFQRLYRKLHVRSRPQLIVRVMAEHLAFAAISNGADRTTNFMSSAHATDEHVTCRGSNGRAY